ncbi:hypothetical protein NPX13_g4450 [Xylaria arbuscula]|uniref:Uncharacterized protein n=1 Tax=Xylaria arbuscula TaxID=114810 RepID=A0A9W8NGT3_9PEZI|nr:hypothetical protein NPX13_g4450 [Xylaria arbuscula]
MSDQFLGMVMQTMQPGPLVPLVAVLGDSGVGKTALVMRLYNQQFIGPEYDPTIEDSYKIPPRTGQKDSLEVLDTAGHEYYRHLQDKWIKQADGIILVYSVAKRNTFRTIRHLVEQVLSVKKWHPEDKAPDSVRPERLPIMIVGNQSDRLDEQEVDGIEGHALAKKYGCMFVEASAKHNRNVEKAFFDVVKLLRKPLYQEVYDDGLSSERAPSQSSIWKAWRATFLGIGCCIFIYLGEVIPVILAVLATYRREKATKQTTFDIIFECFQASTKDMETLEDFVPYEIPLGGQAGLLFQAPPLTQTTQLSAPAV